MFWNRSEFTSWDNLRAISFANHIVLHLYMFENIFEGLNSGVGVSIATKFIHSLLLGVKFHETCQTSGVSIWLLRHTHMYRQHSVCNKSALPFRCLPDSGVFLTLYLFALSRQDSTLGRQSGTLPCEKWTLHGGGPVSTSNKPPFYFKLIWFTGVSSRFLFVDYEPDVKGI